MALSLQNLSNGAENYISFHFTYLFLILGFLRQDFLKMCPYDPTFFFTLYKTITMKVLPVKKIHTIESKGW